MASRLTLLDASRTTGDDYVDTPLGVAAVLRSIASSRARAALYLDEGDTFLHTTVLAVEGDAFFFEQGPDPRLNARVVTTPQATLVTSDRSVPVQFAVIAPEAAKVEGQDAFRALLPQRLLRLQRRDFYRLPGHSINSLVRCELVPGDDASKIVRPVVIDISCGGMAVDIALAEAVLADGSRHTCTVDFPGLGRIDTPLYVCSSREIGMSGGARGRRYGIEFLNLEAKGIALIQRFINDEERRLIRSNKR
jgi:flagellar brake protein